MNATVIPRRAKIVCTLGPSSSSESALRDLMGLGMDVARLNFSHGTHEEHARMIDRMRKVAEREGRTICILQDLQGPKIRTGRLKYRTPVALKSGSHITITPRDIPGTSSLIATTFKTLAQQVEPGARILMSGSSPSWKSHRPLTTWKKSWMWLMESWWRAAIWAWRCPRKKFRSFRSTSSVVPPNGANRSLLPPRCWNPWLKTPGLRARK